MRCRSWSQLRSISDSRETGLGDTKSAGFKLGTFAKSPCERRKLTILTNANPRAKWLPARISLIIRFTTLRRTKDLIDVTDVL